MADPLDRLGAAAIPEEPGALKRRLAALALSALGVALLLHNARGTTVGAPPAVELEARLAGFRGWDDVAIAIGHHASGEFPLAPYRVLKRARRNQEDFVAFRDRLLGEVTRSRIPPQQFWRKLDGEAFRYDELFLARRWDDPGRAALLAAGFRVLGGVAPFLLPWLGVLMAAPVLAWLSAELVQAGRPVASGLMAVAVAGSAFVVDLLMLGYSAAGFSLLVIVLAGALAVHACLGRPSPRGLLARATFAGGLFAVFASARSVSLLSLPGVALVLWIAARRARRVGPSPVLALACSLLFIAPYGLLRLWSQRRLESAMHHLNVQRRPSQLHDIWLGLWEGLGDFDREKGHEFLDQAAEIEARRHGIPWRLTQGSEALFRRLVLEHIRADPAWYASILARRVWATVTLEKLAPWGPRDGRRFAPATHAAEGVTDNYWGMTLGADCFRLGRRTWEAPLSLLLLPSIGLVAVALFAPDPLRAEARRGIGVTACVALAALPAPVLGSTASAFEAQSFAPVHFAAAALLAQSAWDALRRAVAARAGSRP